MGRRAWQAMVCGIAGHWSWLRDWTYTHVLRIHRIWVGGQVTTRRESDRNHIRKMKRWVQKSCRTLKAIVKTLVFYHKCNVKTVENSNMKSIMINLSFHDHTDCWIEINWRKEKVKLGNQLNVCCSNPKEKHQCFTPW